MKKISLIVSVILTLCFICSCAGEPAPAVTETKEITETETEKETETETETETEAVTEEEKPVRTFTNPISTKSMPDPYITYHDGYYYGLATEVPNVRLYKNKTVEDLFINGEYKDVITVGADIGGGKTLGWNEWAPEIHYLPTTGRWYIYFCACTDGFDFESMRMCCLESDGDDPFGDYTFKGTTVSDRKGIDQTVWYDEQSGELYTAYCDFSSDNKGQVLMLATMSKPWEVGETRVRISVPAYSWEKRGSDGQNDGRVNEGPIFFTSGGKIYIIYSASGCWCQYYTLGMLTYVGEDTSKENFLNPDNWIKSKDPIFKKANGVYAPGHCSFFTSPDGTETWIAYHGMATPDAGVEGRYAYIQKIEIAEDGSPVLGKPLPRDTKINVPSGEE